MKNLVLILTLIFGALLLTPSSAQAAHRRSRGYHSSHGRVVVVVHPRRHRVYHSWAPYRRVVIVHHRHHHHGHGVIIGRRRY